MHNQKRRELLIGAGVLAGASMFPSVSIAQSAKLRVGLMLPYTGTFAQLGVAIENGFRLALEQAGGKFGGREIKSTGDGFLVECARQFGVQAIGLEAPPWGEPRPASTSLMIA